MPSIDKTKQALESMFITGWGSTTEISHDNVFFDDIIVDEFVSMKFINYTSKNVNIGGALVKRKRHTGVLSIKIFTKQHIGTGVGYGYVTQITDFMDNKQQTNLFTGVSDVRRLGEDDDGWFGLIVDIPYISDEV